jgi:Transposase DDE domain
MEDRHTSHHFRKRREESEKQGKEPRKHVKSSFPKLALLCDCLSHLTLSMQTDRGPGADHKYFKPLMDHASEMFLIRRVLADAGFDSEHHHVWSREQHGAQAIIPPITGRPTGKPPTGAHRRDMKENWEKYKKRYGQRWQVETVNSMLKRLLGSALRAIKHWNRNREMVLRMLTLNIMIIAAAT